jgi:hypothetical protein
VNRVATALTLAALLAARSLSAAQSAAPAPDGPPPRAADGKADLSGVWNKGLVVNTAKDAEPLPFTPEGLKAFNDVWNHIDPTSRCIFPGVPRVNTSPYPMQIVQLPDKVIFLYEYMHNFRVVYTDGRGHRPDWEPSLLGDSVGRWDGDTLVVESNGYNDRTWLDHDGHPHTEALRITERYRRRDVGHLDIDVTIADPKAYAKPWTVSVKAELAPDTEMIEFVCGEKNTSSLAHWVGKASDERKDEAAVAPQVLAKYVGTYDEQPKYWRNEPRTVVISVSGGRLFGNLNGQGAVPLVARSTTLFSGLNGLGVEFVQGAGGVPSTLFVKHVSGDYAFTRRR